MGKVVLKKGTKIHSAGTICDKLEIVLGGSVRVYDAYKSFTITGGGIVGVLETPNTSYNYTYEALEDVTLFDYSYSKNSDVERVLVSNAKILPNIISAQIRSYLECYQAYQRFTKDAESLYSFIRDSYSGYVELCEKYKVPVQALTSQEDLAEYVPDDELHSWELQYFSAIRGLDAEAKKTIYNASAHIGAGIVMQCIDATFKMLSRCSSISEYLCELSACAISSESGDFFDLYSNLVVHVSSNPFADTTPVEAAVSKLIIFLQDSPYLDKQLVDDRIQTYRNQLRELEEMMLNADDDIVASKDVYEELDRSMETIFDYARVDVNLREGFRELIEKYKLMSDKNATDDVARRLRRSISDDFYEVYEKAFFASLTDRNVPVVIKMFFYFGYLDEELAGMNNASILYDFAKNMKKDPEGRIVTMYDWLVQIYEGKAEPSKNEFDLDYLAYLREQKSLGNISEAEEKEMQTDPASKVKYEIANLFTTGNRITFGRISTFCPILSEHNILRPLQSILVKPEDVYKAFDEIRSIDFSAFYRDVMYTNKAAGIQMEYIGKEVLPNVILMPNVGTRCSLWQETANSRRDSMGRMLLSVLPTENLQDMLIRLTGEFRWELCKKIQGVRWNDVTDPSLTSEYSDYIQFYRKNRELSTDAKEKLKLQLQKAKNNYREVFVQDYVQWIKYEGQGSPRLNRYARGILFRYCPFPKATRDSIAVNPMYSELLEKYNVKLSQRLHSLDLVFAKVKNMGQETPAELVEQRRFLEM